MKLFRTPFLYRNYGILYLIMYSQCMNLRNILLSLKFKLLRDLKTIIFAIILSIFSCLILFFFRLFDHNTFLFIQILWTFCIVSVLIYFFSSNFPVRFFAGRELASIVIAFLIITFSIINIDRSRSLYLIKWVGSNSNGVTFQNLAMQKKLENGEILAFRQRVEEQQQSKILEIDNDKLMLTAFGKIIFFVSNFFASILNLDGYKKA